MSFHFQFSALSADEFTHWWAMTDDELKEHSAKRLVADSITGYPCRVSLKDADIGEQILAVPYQYHDVNSFYQASGPIYVREHAATAKPAIDTVPVFLEQRLISIRAYDQQALMQHADAVSGTQLKDEISQLFSNSGIAYIQLHNARTGCYLCQASRVGEA